MKHKENKVSITMRVDKEVLEYYKNDGRGYQTRINDVLRFWMSLEQSEDYQKLQDKRRKQIMELLSKERV